MKQGFDESLKLYLTPFKKILSKTKNSDDTRIEALQTRKVTNKASLQDLFVNRPNTILGDLYSTLCNTEYVEEKLFLSKIQRTHKDISPNETNEEHQEPRQHKYIGRNTWQLPSKSEKQKARRKGNSLKNTYNQNEYCAFHKRTSHATSKCKQLQELLTQKYSKGNVKLSEEEAEKFKTPKKNGGQIARSGEQNNGPSRRK